MSCVQLSEGGFQVVCPLGLCPNHPESSESYMDKASNLFPFTHQRTLLPYEHTTQRTNPITRTRLMIKGVMTWLGHDIHPKCYCWPTCLPFIYHAQQKCDRVQTSTCIIP